VVGARSELATTDRRSLGVATTDRRSLGVATTDPAQRKTTRCMSLDRRATGPATALKACKAGGNMHGERKKEPHERSERGDNGVADPAQRKTTRSTKARIGELQALQPRSRHAKREAICMVREEKSPASAARGA
jgi:hypothetical protein